MPAAPACGQPRRGPVGQLLRLPKSIGTAQVVCYVRSAALGEVVRGTDSQRRAPDSGHSPLGRNCRKMNSITLHQPWASLMAAQLKYIETRSWMPPPRCVFKRMAIHASAKRSKHYPNLHMRALERHYGPLWQMPFGVVVATATLMTVCQVVGHSNTGEVLYTLVEGRKPPGGIGEDPGVTFRSADTPWYLGTSQSWTRPSPRGVYRVNHFCRLRQWILPL